MSGPGQGDEAIAALQELGRRFYARGFSFGTSGNYSVVQGRAPLRLLITASGKDKERLSPGDFVVIDEAARPIAEGAPRPSAEAWLHVAIAARPSVGAVLHTHSVWSTILSDRFAAQGAVEIEGYEMLKGLAGVQTHEHRLRVEIFENTQDMAGLAREVSARLAAPSDGLAHAFLLRRHGLYTWGETLDDARRQVEILEFLFEVIGRSDDKERASWRM